MMIRVKSVPELGSGISDSHPLHQNDFFLTLDVITDRDAQIRERLNECESPTEFFTFDNTLSQGAPNALPSLFLVSIITCAIK
jgi:hypothetical protein